MRSLCFSVVSICALVGPYGPSSAAQSPTCVFVEQALAASAPQSSSQFGRAVDLDGDTLVVGAPLNSPAGANSGEAFVFARSAGGWAQQQSLLGSTTAPFDYFGSSVAVAGDLVAVGAPGHSAAGKEGAVYVFERSGATWTEIQELTWSGTGTHHGFGRDVSLRGGELAVFVEDRSVPPGALLGTAVIHAQSGALFTPSSVATAPFMENLAFDGTTVALGGVPSFSFPVPGSVHVLRRNAGAWVSEGFVQGAPTAGFDDFSHSIAVSGDRLAVSDPEEPTRGAGAGAVYLFVRQAGVWVNEDKLFASDADPGAAFGVDLDLEGDRLVTRGWSKTYGTHAVYVFERQGGVWSESAIQPLAPSSGGGLGDAIALDGARAVVGSPADAAFTGLARVLAFADAPAAYCTPRVNSCGSVPTIQAGGMPSASATSGFVVSALSTRAGRPGILLHGVNGPANLPFQGGTLCVQTPLRRSVVAFDTLGTPGQCDGLLSLDVNAFAHGLLGGNPLPALSQVGTVVHAQWWGRDTAAHGPLLTDGLTWTVCH